MNDPKPETRKKLAINSFLGFFFTSVLLWMFAGAAFDGFGLWLSLPATFMACWATYMSCFIAKVLWEEYGG